MGYSLPIWNAWFPHAKIYGFDKFSPQRYQTALEYLKPFERAHIFQGKNSQEHDSVASIGWDKESMDIVIDDGDHSLEGQQRTLDVMWPYLKPGGFYIIEDVEWNKYNLGSYAFIHEFARLTYVTKKILSQNDAFFVDSTTGHRSWESWQKRQGKQYVIDRYSHNSHA